MIPLFAAGQHDVEQFLLRILLQLIVIVVAARAGGWLFRRIGQPQVCGEIAAGILLGPSCFGLLAPDTWSAIFPQDSDLGIVMKVLAEIGLILLMFLMGQDFEFGQLRKIGPQALAVSIAGVVLPFVMGFALAWQMHPAVAAQQHQLGFALFVAVALSITAIPVLGRIMMEFDLTRTRIGVLTITAAAVDDATGWIMLAAVSAVVLGNLVPSTIVVMLAATLAFCAVVLLVVRPLAKRLIQRSLARNNGDITLGGLAWLLVAVFTAAVATNLIGIFSIFGPFVLGAALWDEHDFREAVHRRLRDFVTVFFLPIFFTYTGLRTRVMALDSGELWLYCGLILAAAIAGKVIGCGLATRIGGQMTWTESACVGVMMNTRGLVELIVINLGREMGVLPESVFCMLVIMALVTTFMTAPLLTRLLARDETIRLRVGSHAA